MNKKILNELADERLSIEQQIATMDSTLRGYGSKYHETEKLLNKLKTEKHRISLDINLLFKGKSPRHSIKFRKK